MDVQSILIAQNWQDSWKDIHYLLASLQRDLEKYKAKETYDPKWGAIKAETIARIKNFVDVTGALVDEQAEMLQKERGLSYKYKSLEKDYAVLYSYARSKGLDVSLLPYMSTRDFNVRL